MATVPGSPIPDDPIPKELRPTQADLMIAAHQVLSGQQQMKLAGDVKDLSSYFQGAQDMNKALRIAPTPKEQTEQVLKRALGAGKVLPMTPEDK